MSREGEPFCRPHFFGIVSRQSPHFVPLLPSLRFHSLFREKSDHFFRYFLLAHVNFCFALDVFRKGGRLLQKYCGIKTDSLLCFCLLILLEQEKRRKICGEMNLEGPLRLLLRFFSLTSGDTGEEKVPEVISNFIQTTGEMGAIVFVQVRIRFAKFVIFL